MIHPIERSLTALIIGGVLERYPRLKIVSAENDVAWIPFFLYRIDNTRRGVSPPLSCQGGVGQLVEK